MLSFFRRMVQSTIGKFVALAILVMIALAFAAGDITGLRPQGAGTSAGNVVEVGKQAITEVELKQRLQTALNGARQQNPTLDMSQFVNGGGFERVVDQLVSGLALEELARQSGMVASKAAIDGEIAGIQAFQGVDGKFSQTVFDSVLAQQNISPAQLRQDISRELLVQWLAAPTVGASQVPNQLALPYASLMMERREGNVGFIPVTAVNPGPAPTDAELTQYYTRNRTRYTVPERRVLRYATVLPDRFAELKPSEAEIAAAYRADAAKYAPSEKRTIRQVVVADQAGATALLAKVKAGTPIAEAARAAGLEASTADKVDKAAFATQSAAAVADAAFGAAQGGVVGPVRSPLGWHILQVEAVEKVAGKPLDAVRAELTAAVGKRKIEEALSAMRDKLDASIGDGATFAELAGDAKAEIKVTPPMVADGRSIDNPTAQPDPLLAGILQGGFAAEQGDDPQLVPVGTDGGFAIVSLDRIVPAAPRLLAEIREPVTRDLLIDRGLQQARKVALAAIAAIGKGMTIQQALAASGLKLPPAQAVKASRAQLAESQQQLPPPVVLMFSMAEKNAKLLEAPNRGGWFVVHLDKIERGDASKSPEIVQRTRGAIGTMAGREYLEQFGKAAERLIGVKRNAAALAKIKADLGGQSQPAN